MAKDIKRKRNMPLIITGIIVLIVATILKGSAVGLETRALLDVLQLAGIIVALMGFGVSWKKKSGNSGRKEG